MSSLIQFLLIDCCIATYVSVDLLRTIRTGRARTWNGAATREHQSARYWRYVHENCAMLAVCVAGFVGALLIPDSLGS